ncbi:MAG: hypothetical protein V2I66_00505 [Halieaceae bacterium]|jgi:hypothetical protein|nr:hypothetical protein [Halieaceae bacterium]
MVNHAISLNGAFPGAGNSERLRPTVLELKDQAFLERMFSQLGSSEGRMDLRSQQAATRRDDGTLRLYQPVHRLFNVTLLDISCQQFGMPRLDPAQILSSGVVVRRVGKHGLEGWMHENGSVAGWKPLPAAMDDYDVEPALRQQRRLGSNHRVLKRRAEYDAAGDFQEQSTSLFVAPPEVADGSGRTYVYGMVPLTSTERIENAPAPAAPFDRDDVLTRLPPLLRQGGNGRSGLPPTGTTITTAMRRDPAAEPMFRVLRYLANECGLYTGADDVEELQGVLDGIALSGWGSLGNFLRRANDILLGGPEDPDNPPPSATQITTPGSWPSINSTVANKIVGAIEKAMRSRWAQMAAPESRYESGEHRYVLQCFIRVACEPGCPPKALWTEATEPFEIVPWYESSDAVPPTVVELPDVTKEALKKLKPNVSFKVPESLQKIMDNIDVKGLMDGEEPARSSWGFGMICSFSIPLITICAFIVLQIFIGLLNLAFWWSAFIRICIPFPKKN